MAAVATYPLSFALTSAGDSAQALHKLVTGAQALARMDPADVAVAPTPKQVAHRDGAMRLYHYERRGAGNDGAPLLIVYALFNRYYMLDLQPDRSLVGHLLDAGMDTWLIDWGYPTRVDRWLTLDDYVNGYIDDCVDVVRAATGAEQVNLLGVCQGGCAALCYGALHPQKVHTLTTMVTPVDFHAGGNLVTRWIRDGDVDTAVDALEMIPGELVSLGFSMRSPFQRNVRKYLDLVDLLDDERRLANFLRMERWIYDTPDVPGETFRQWIKDFYQGNKLINGEVELGGRRVDLAAIRMPVLNVYAERDDLITPESSQVLGQHVGTQDYTGHSLPVGHIGMYVSGRAQRELPPILAAWLEERS